MATRRAISQVTARAGIRGTDEHRPRRERHRALRARHVDDPVLEWLTESLEGPAAELGQLVEEENAVVSKAHLAGPRQLPSPDERDVAGRVMWRSKRANPHPRCAAEKAGDTLNGEHLERLVA